MSFSSPNTIEKERYYDFIFKNLSHIMILRAVGHACCVSVAVWDTLTKKFPCPEMGLCNNKGTGKDSGTQNLGCIKI